MDILLIIWTYSRALKKRLQITHLKLLITLKKKMYQDFSKIEYMKRRNILRNYLKASLLRTFADVVGNLEEISFTPKQIEDIKAEVVYYEKVRDEIKLASGDYIDLKRYEADMRHFIDNYISADESEKLSAFDDMSLIAVSYTHLTLPT